MYITFLMADGFHNELQSDSEMRDNWFTGKHSGGTRDKVAQNRDVPPKVGKAAT